MELFLKILIGVAAVGLGIWLGLPGKYEQSQEDIERAMDQGGARRNTVKKVPTPLDWLRKDKRGSQRRIDAGRRRFRTAVPEKPSGERRGGTGDSSGGAPGSGDAEDRPSAADEFEARHRDRGASPSDQ